MEKVKEGGVSAAAVPDNELTPEGSTPNESFNSDNTDPLKGSQSEAESSDACSQGHSVADQSPTEISSVGQSPCSFPLAETVLLCFSVAVMIAFWVIAGVHGDPEWFNRGGALALVLVAVAEHTAHDRQLRKIRSKTYGDVRLGDPIIPKKTRAESIITGSALVLLIIGTIVWGFGDFFYAMVYTV
jgi:hypothetical protein